MSAAIAVMNAAAKLSLYLRFLTGPAELSRSVSAASVMSKGRFPTAQTAESLCWWECHASFVACHLTDDLGELYRILCLWALSALP